MHYIAEHLRPSMEAIRYQGKAAFFTELVIALKTLRELGLKQKNHVPTLSQVKSVQIPEIIRRYTNLSFSFALSNTAGHHNAYVIFPLVDVNSPLLVEWRSLGEALVEHAVSFQALKKKSDSMRVSIDLEEGRVTGVITTLTSQMFLSEGLLTDERFSTEELAAILLHEVGHTFTYFEKLVSNVSINAVISTAAQALSRTTDPVLRLELVNAAADALHVTPENAQDLAAIEDTDVFQMVMLKTTVDQYLHSASNSKVYDLRNCEFLADQFAVRQGAGRYLATAVDRLQRLYHKESYRSNAGYAMVEAGKAAMMILTAFLITTTAVATMTLSLAGLLMMLSLSNPEARLYDQPSERLGRMKNDLVQILKDLTVPQEVRNRLLMDIEVIDGLRDQMRDRRSLFNYLWIVVSSKRREQFNQLKLHQELEGLINNNLFVHATKLQSLAS